MLEKIPEQFGFKPEIANTDRLGSSDSFVIGGMGGSHLAASLIRDEGRVPNMIIHTDYGLPRANPSEPERARVNRETLFIAVSHSGNTEETLDFARSAMAAQYRIAVIAGGGTLRSLAEENNLPFITIPKTDMPPRLATGYMAAALLALMGMNEKLAEFNRLSEKLHAAAPSLNDEARVIAEKMNGRIPLVYSSGDNYSLAYYWKIALNETSKTPAFANQFPELNHNELAGFTVNGSAAPYCLITIQDPEDDSRIAKRMDLTEKILAEKDASTVRVKLAGETRLERYWRSAYLAIAASFALADIKGVDPISTEFIERFKKSLDR